MTIRSPLDDIKPMKGYDKWFRLYKRSYRVLFGIDQQEQVIGDISINDGKSFESILSSRVGTKAIIFERMATKLNNTNSENPL